MIRRGKATIENQSTTYAPARTRANGIAALLIKDCKRRGEKVIDRLPDPASGAENWFSTAGRPCGHSCDGIFRRSVTWAKDLVIAAASAARAESLEIICRFGASPEPADLVS